MEASIKQTNLEALVKAYIFNRLETRALEKQRESIVKPRRPKQVDSLDDLASFVKLNEEFEAQIGKMERTQAELLRGTAALQKEIIESVPVRNVWIKVEEWAVATYWDTWGGGHTALDIRKWQNNLPEATDHTYYP